MKTEKQVLNQLVFILLNYEGQWKHSNLSASEFIKKYYHDFYQWLKK